MTTGRVFVAGSCIVAGSLIWSAAALAQSGAGAEVIGVHGAGTQGIAPGAAMEWTAGAPVQMDFDILTGPLELSRGAVKDAPYSAEAVTEVVQTLAGRRLVPARSGDLGAGVRVHRVWLHDARPGAGR